ncbi:MAG: phosphohydrolase, partial [Terracidiphilus sp.]
QLISAADKLYNARTILDEYRAIGPRVWQRFRRSRDHQLWYFHELLKVFKSAGTNRIVEELDRVVAELESISAGETTVG